MSAVSINHKGGQKRRHSTQKSLAATSSSSCVKRVKEDDHHTSDINVDAKSLYDPAAIQTSNDEAKAKAQGRGHVLYDIQCWKCGQWSTDVGVQCTHVKCNTCATVLIGLCIADGAIQKLAETPMAFQQLSSRTSGAFQQLEEAPPMEKTKPSKATRRCYQCQKPTRWGVFNSHNKYAHCMWTHAYCVECWLPNKLHDGPYVLGDDFYMVKWSGTEWLQASKADLEEAKTEANNSHR